MGPPNAAFIAQADGICTKAWPKIQSDISAMQSGGDPSAYASDLQALVTQLKGLGTPPSDDGSMGDGVQDWQQALGDLGSGDTQTFSIDYTAGLHAFADVGLKVCSGGISG